MPCRAELAQQPVLQFCAAAGCSLPTPHQCQSISQFQVVVQTCDLSSNQCVCACVGGGGRGVCLLGLCRWSTLLQQVWPEKLIQRCSPMT